MNNTQSTSGHKPKTKLHISSSDTPQTVSGSPAGRGFSRASSADSVFDDISSKAHALFSILDEENKGYLDNQVLLKVCDSGLTESQINDLILQLDHDGDGKVSADDFMLGLRTLAKRNSLIRASLRATTVTNSSRYLIKRCSDSSDSPRSRLGSDETGSDVDDKLYNKHHAKISCNTIQSVRIRTKSRQRLHQRILTLSCQQTTTSKLVSQSSASLPDISSVDESLKCLNSQDHLYELYHILLSENPSLSRMYETVLVDVVCYIQRTREIQLRLEKQIESERVKHSEAIFRLSEELDNQVKLAEEAARLKERESAMIKFSTELETKSLQIKQLKSKIKHLEEQEIHQRETQNQTIVLKNNELDDSRIIKLQTKILQVNQENYNLEEDLDNTRLQLAQSRSEFNAVRQSLNDKTQELEHHMSALIETVKENSTLKRQVGILQDINKKLYDANDSLYNMFESYPECLRKQWKVEDIKPASTTVDHKFRRTSKEYKSIKSVVKAFHVHESEDDIATCVSCASDQIDKTRSEQPECSTLKTYRSGDSGLSIQKDVREIESDEAVKLLNDKQKLWGNSGNHLKYGIRSELQNKSSSTTSVYSNNCNYQSSASYSSSQPDSHGKNGTIKRQNKKILSSKESYHIKSPVDEKLRIFRIMLAGDSEVGKTSLLIRMCDNVFTASSVTTIGIDMKMRSVEVDGRKAMMQIWDTAGQERQVYIVYTRESLNI
ncbi:unnamed protein product [Trichobilharzia szidati]|nr:unnamed protein product [Trichobilharzia szidati]